jgi:hypothetical protein
MLIVIFIPIRVQWSTATHTDPKDAIDIYAKSFALAVSGLGLVLGYRKYIRGRLFAERADLLVAVRPVRWNSQGLLHEATVQIRNTGTVAIWLPTVYLRVYALDDDEVLPSKVRSGALTIPTPPLGIEVVEPGATHWSTFWFRVPDNIDAFRASVDVESGRSTLWHRSAIVANALAVSDEEREERADVAVDVKLVGDEPALGGIHVLHAANVSVRNCGRVPIVARSLEVQVLALDADEVRGVPEWNDGPQVPPQVPDTVVPGASCAIVRWFRVPGGVPAFRVITTMTSERGTRWVRTVVVANPANAREQE